MVKPCLYSNNNIDPSSISIFPVSQLIFPYDIFT